MQSFRADLSCLDNTVGNENSPKNNGEDASNQPGLKAMTMKAIEVLSKRSKADGDKGFVLMSEAASIDKVRWQNYPDTYSRS